MTVELSSAKFFEQSQQSSELQQTLAAANEANPLQKNPHRMPSWTNKLTLIMVLCGVMGAFGLLSTGLGIVGVINGPAQAKAAMKLRNAPPKMIQNTIKLQKKYAVPQLFVLLVKGAAAAMLLVSCAFLAMKKRNGRQLTVNACYGALGFHIMNAALKALYIIGMSGIAKEMAQSKVKGDELNAIMGLFSFGGVIVILVAFLFFLAIYGSMLMHLCSPQVRQIFGENPYPEKSDMTRRAQQGLKPSLM